jgi:transcription elongation factor Elf1
MSVVYKCGVHGFETGDIDEFEAHIKSSPHSITIGFTCTFCGTTQSVTTDKFDSRGQPIIRCQTCGERHRL